MLRPAPLQIINGAVDNYTDELRTSKFCLAPYGAGWGIRVSISMAYGCVPVIIQDNVYQVGCVHARATIPPHAMLMPGARVAGS